MHKNEYKNIKNILGVFLLNQAGISGEQVENRESQRDN